MEITHKGNQPAGCRSEYQNGTGKLAVVLENEAVMWREPLSQQAGDGDGGRGRRWDLSSRRDALGFQFIEKVLASQ